MRTVSYSLIGNKKTFCDLHLHIGGHTHSFVGSLIKLMFLDCGKTHTCIMTRRKLQREWNPQPSCYEENSAVVKFSGKKNKNKNRLLGRWKNPLRGMFGIRLCSGHSVNHRGRGAVFTDATLSRKVIGGLTSLPLHSVRHRSLKPDREIRAAVIQASPRR